MKQIFLRKNPLILREVSSFGLILKARILELGNGLLKDQYISVIFCNQNMFINNILSVP